MSTKTKFTITCTCDRCGATEDVIGSGDKRPPGWGKLGSRAIWPNKLGFGVDLCGSCVTDMRRIVLEAMQRVDR